MAIAERPSPRQKHFREMAVWHEWPEDEVTNSHRDKRRANVGPKERWFDALAGVSLAAFGLSKRGVVGYTMAGAGAALLARGATGYCPAYRSLGINTARRGEAEPQDYYEYGIQVSKSVTINLAPEALYNFWRDLSNLPTIMSHVESVEVIDETLSRWTVSGPMNSHMSWDAEIINEEPHELIAWRSLPGAEIDNAGSVRFVRAPGGRGTHVRVNIEYLQPAGKIGAFVASMFGQEPNQQVREDLRRFKQIMEAGEIPTIEGQPQGRCTGRSSAGKDAIRERFPGRHRARGFTGSAGGTSSADDDANAEIREQFPQGRSDSNEMRND